MTKTTNEILGEDCKHQFVRLRIGHKFDCFWVTCLRCEEFVPLEECMKYTVTYAGKELPLVDHRKEDKP